MKNTNKTKGIMASIITSFAVVGLVTSINASQTIKFSRAEDVEYVLTLYSNLEFTGKTEINATTLDGNNVKCCVYKMSNYDNDTISFNNYDWVNDPPMLLNKDAISGIKKIVFSGVTLYEPSDYDPEECWPFYMLFSWGWSRENDFPVNCYETDDSLDTTNFRYSSYEFDFNDEKPDFFDITFKGDAIMTIESIAIYYSCLTDGTPECYQGALAFMTYERLTSNTVGYNNYYSSNYSTIVFPQTIRGMTVVKLGTQVFYSRTPHPEVTSVTLPATLKILDQNALAFTSISEMEIPNGVETIGLQCFYNCTNLTKVFIPNTVTSIGKDLFKNIESQVTIYTSFSSWGEIVSALGSYTNAISAFSSINESQFVYNATVEQYRAA